MTAVANLPEKWRKEAAAEWTQRQNKDLSEWVRDRCHGQHARLLSCADELEAALSPAELGGVETEQSIAADCYHWIAECIGTLPGYSVQEHVQTMKETLEACSDFLHDFVPSDEGGCDEAVELARNCRAVLSGRIDQYESTPRAAESVVDDAMVERACIEDASESYPYTWDHLPDSVKVRRRKRMTEILASALTPPSAKGE